MSLGLAGPLRGRVKVGGGEDLDLTWDHPAQESQHRHRAHLVARGSGSFEGRIEDLAIVVSGHLAHELARGGGGLGLATLCVGGGQGQAVVLEVTG